MEEARIYTMQGRLLQKERGKFAQFELERGEYRLFAKVNGETVTRRIEPTLTEKLPTALWAHLID